MQVNCPRCEAPAEFPDSLAGAEARCPGCGGLIPLPSGGEEIVQRETASAEIGEAHPQVDGTIDSGTEVAPQPREGGWVFARLEGAQVSDSEVLDPSRVPPARPRPLWTKLVLVGLPLVLLLGVAGTYLGLQLSRQAYAKRVAARFAEAEDVYGQGEMEACEKMLSDGLKMMEARPEAIPAEWAGDLKKKAEKLRSHIGHWREAREIKSKAQIEPAATRRKLEDQLRIVSALGPDAEPVATLIREMGKEVYELDLSDRREGLQSHLAGLQQQLDEGKFRSARQALEQGRQRIAKAPGAMAGKLRKEFEPRFVKLDAVFKFREETDKFVKSAPAGGPKRAAVQAELRKRLAALDPKGPGAKGLAKQSEKWIKELQKDARPLPQGLSLNFSLLKEIAKDFAAAAPGLKLDENSIDENKALFRLSSKDHNYRVVVANIGGRDMFVIEVDGVRLAYPAITKARKDRRPLIRYEMAQAPLLAKTLKESGREEAWSASPWNAVLQGPAPTAILPRKVGPLLCVADRVWNVTFESRNDARKQAAGTFIEAAQKLEKAISADERAGKDLRDMLVLMVQASYRPRKSASDFLPGPFCRQAVARGYIKKNAPELAKRLVAERAAYRTAYKAITRFYPNLTGQADAGDELEWGRNTDGRGLWRIHDAKAGTTTFALRHSAPQFPSQFFVHTVFSGKHSSWPVMESPKAVHMVHQSIGKVASWDPESDKLVFEKTRWRLAAELDNMRSLKAHFGRPEWRFPPHVLLTDSLGNALGLVTPAGRLDMPEFGKRKGAARRKAQDAFIDKCAKTLKSAGELHLLFKYFVKYTYDSPLTAYPFLIGDKQNTGDVHQDAYQTLDRKIAGRFIADCDDLAEFYQAITRRQKRLSFVLGRPSHAICGFVEKKGGDYLFTSVDTGPPRQFRAKKLDEVIEAGFATFDQQRTEAFDASSICFLLRFAGEQTRTPYFLGTRMFVDPAYAKTLIRVQRDWHFAYIASGRDTMKEMVKRDTDPATIFELAALYRELGEWPLAIKWTKTGIAKLSPEDVKGRLTENLRLARYLERSGNRKAATQLMIETGGKIDKAAAAAGPKAIRYAGLRFSAAGMLRALDRPWAAWKVAEPATRALVRAGRLGGNNVTGLATILLSMRDMERGGRKLSKGETTAAKELDGLLEQHFATRHFKERDTFGDHMDKYADLAIFYAARKGRAYALQRLLAAGPYPSTKRAHHLRGAALTGLEDEDWKWIRVSIHAYNHFFGVALDARKPAAERRTAEAVKVLAALEKAVPEIRKHGALGGLEFAILSMQVRRDAITKNWAGLEKSFQLMKKRNWGQLYRMMARSLGDASAYMTDAEFEEQFRKFCDQSPPLPHYFRAAYAALGEKRYGAAERAARITAERFPAEAAVQREYKLLKEILKRRKAAAGSKKPPEKKPEAGAAREFRPAAG